MKLGEYAGYDALGLAELVAKKEVSPGELALTARDAIAAVDEELNAVVEIYDDRIEGLKEDTLGSGPFRGVPFLIKDVLGHERGKKIEFGSRLCEGMLVEDDTHVGKLFKASGLNILGRSNTPEYSMSGTAENLLYGNTSTPWKKGYSAGGSTGGGMAAVVAGIVPIAHGTDIAGSIRIPACWCGGVGLKPSRGRISFGPTMPDKPYADFLDKPADKLKVGWSVDPLMGVQSDPEIVRAVKNVATLLEEAGHEVSEESPVFDGLASVRKFADMWFFGFDLRLQGYSKRSGHKIGPDTLEPMIWKIYEHARGMTSADFMSALAEINIARRKLAAYYDRYDIWLSPTIARVSEPHGNYNLGRTDLDMDNYVEEILAVPAQFTVPHNIMGTPAITLPLAMHSTGLPIGIQLGARFANEHVLLQLAAMLEQAMPWSDRIPPIHVSHH